MIGRQNKSPRGVLRKGGVSSMQTQKLKQSILVVDDYDEFRKLLRMRLEQRGYLVLEAADGQEAVEVAERELPDLILMDFNLPVLDGFIATQYIRQLDALRNIPIVGVTAHGKKYSQNVALAAGCNDYLEKPLDFEELYLVINRWLSKQSNQQADSRSN
jgi:two-component system cell cycle response regulator DivK